MKKRVMCFGTFDILHPGHIAFLESARSRGDELLVVVSRDERRAAVSGSRPVHTQKERCRMLQALRAVTRAIPGHKTDILAAVRANKPQIIALGHDQVYGVQVLEHWASKQKNPPMIVRLPAFSRARYSTSRIKASVCQTNT